MLAYVGLLKLVDEFRHKPNQTNLPMYGDFICSNGDGTHFFSFSRITFYRRLRIIKFFRFTFDGFGSFLLRRCFSVIL